MYPPVTQFETRHRTILDELRIREERQLARPSTSPIPRATALPRSRPVAWCRSVSDGAGS
jgi:hypothetical protein